MGFPSVEQQLLLWRSTKIELPFTPLTDDFTSFSTHELNLNSLFAADQALHKRAATMYKAAVTDQPMRLLFLLTVAYLFISETFQPEPIIY